MAAQNTRIWITRTAIPVRISDLGARNASTTGRTTAFNAAIRTMTSTAPIGWRIWMDGSSQSVIRKAMIETSRTITSRLIRAPRPPRHWRRTRICVLYSSTRLFIALCDQAWPAAAGAACVVCGRAGGAHTGLETGRSRILGAPGEHEGRG